MDIEIRAIEARDADAVVACFRRCYGDTYPNDTFYDAAAIADRVRRGELRSAAAVTDAGVLVGHTGLTLRDPDAQVTEAGNTVVDPDFRGHGILGRMGALLARLCTDAGFTGYVHYPTTAHEVMQHRSVSGGGVETGVMLAYIPAETDYRDIDRSSGRIAATIAYQPFAGLPESRVCLPDAYADLLVDRYRACNIARVRVAGTGALPARGEASSAFGVRRGLRSYVISRAGEDVVARICAASRGESAPVTHVDLLLEDPGVHVAVEQLRAAGFFFCGLLPGFRRGDVLRLQRCADPDLETREPSLANADARVLFERMQRERRESARPGG